MMQSSVDEQDVDLAGLPETLVDSDDEEGYVESSDVSTEICFLILTNVELLLPPFCVAYCV